VGTGAAYLFSVGAVLVPGLFPPSIRGAHGLPPVYFEAAAVILILVGARILFWRKKKRSRRDPQYVSDESVPGEVNITSVFGSASRKVTDRNVSGGQIVSVFGSAKINMADAGLADGGATLDVSAVFGGAEFRVPEDWDVDIQTTNILGGVEDKRARPPAGASGDRLTLTGVCLFGGIEVES